MPPLYLVVHTYELHSAYQAEENERTQAAINSDRQWILDAAIVRVMKAKKELTYEKLKLETIEAVKGHFVPDVPSIKKRIDQLVESDYLKRDEEDMNLYVYVA